MSSGEIAVKFIPETHSRQRAESTFLPEGLLLFTTVLIFTVALLALFGGNVGRFGIPVLTTGAAYLYYRKSPVFYVSFVWWLFFFICFLRRIIDYRSGYSEQSVILAAPYLAALVSVPTMFARSDVWSLRTTLPFGLAFVTTLYGLGVGFLCIPKTTLLVATLSWFSPLVFGFFLYTELVSSDKRDAYIAGLGHTFCWGALLMGTYGVYQFLMAPKWDAQWMVDTGMGSIGSPEPFAIRVFSTMNGPGTLAYSLVAGLMFVLLRRDKISILSRGAGFTALLLSSVRAAWASLALALLLLAVREKKYIGKLLGVAAILVACAGAAMAIEPIRERIQERLLSFTDMQNDTSYQDRTSGYGEMLVYAADAPFGSGLGTMDALFRDKTSLGTRDSGIWEIVLSLGWIGGAAYFGALIMLATNAFSKKVMRTPAELLSACICIGLLGQVAMGSVTGITGVTIWTFGAIAIAPLACAELS